MSAGALLFFLLPSRILDTAFVVVGREPWASGVVLVGSTRPENDGVRMCPDLPQCFSLPVSYKQHRDKAFKPQPACAVPFGAQHDDGALRYPLHGIRL